MPETNGGNEEVDGGRTAYLFSCGSMRAVSLDNHGRDLPQPPSGEEWRLDREFTLGVRDVGIAGVNPETIIRTIEARGCYVWWPDDPARGEPTA